MTFIADRAEPVNFDHAALVDAADAAHCSISTALDDLLPPPRRTEIRCRLCPARDRRITFGIDAATLARWINHFAGSHQCTAQDQPGQGAHP